MKMTAKAKGAGRATMFLSLTSLGLQGSTGAPTALACTKGKNVRFYVSATSGTCFE